VRSGPKTNLQPERGWKKKPTKNVLNVIKELFVGATKSLEGKKLGLREEVGVPMYIICMYRNIAMTSSLHN
jgi:hypothetical protein